MKYLLLVALTQTLLVNTQPVKELSAPIITELVANDDSIGLTWSKVESIDSNDPVLGYVVKVWEVPDVVVYRYDIVDGKKQLVQDKQEAKLDPLKIPSGTPREIKVTGADVTTAKIDNIKYNVLYHIRVLAYTNKVQGPLSIGSGLKIIDN